MGLILIVGAALAGCTRSAAAPSVEEVAALVAATLTAAPLSSASTTPPPSATPPRSATPQPTATPPPSATPTAGPSSTPTAPPLPAGDPRRGLNLAMPDYQDDFSARFNWYEFSDPLAATNLWEEGRLRTTDNLADAYIWWSTGNRSAADVYVEVSAEIGECSGKDGYGLALRVGGENYDRGYTLEFSCDGSFRMHKFISGAAPATLVGWTQSDDIRAEPGAANRMGLLARGSTLAAFANGQLLTQAEDLDYVSGTFGLFASAWETPGLTVYFDDFALWYPSDGPE